MTDETRSVQITKVYDAPIQMVYDAWTQAEHVTKWMKCDAQATLDLEGWEPRVGATFKTRMARGEQLIAASTGRVLAAQSPHLFSYSTDPMPQLGVGEMTVRIELTEVEGGTQLLLTHSGVPNEQVCGFLEAGWGVSLELLKDLVVALTGAFASVRLARKEESEGSE